jgi:anti-sigma B factor antagonist
MAAEDAPLRIEHTADTVVLTGEIDAHTAASVRAALIPVAGCGDVRLDVSAVSFIDSSGLRVVLEAHQALQHEQRRLVLVHPSTPVARLIQVAGLVPHLHVEPPIEPADSVQRVGADR